MTASPPTTSATPFPIQLGHSPDPDDAFMFYGLATGSRTAGHPEYGHALGI
mgnify:CR=1 FL=1